MNTLILLDCLPADTPADPLARRQAMTALRQRMARQAASQLMSLPVRHFAIDSDKPACLLLEGAPAPLGLAISHCGPWLAVAVSACRKLGLDIEHTGKPSQGAELAELLSADEAAWLAALPAGVLPHDPFWHVWTLKEALGKYHGRRWETPQQTRRIHQLGHYAAHLALPEHALLLAIAAAAPLDCRLQYGQGKAENVVPRTWPGSPPSTACQNT